MNSKITIAIDGFSSTGKSTMAKRLASRIGYRYIDSGAMYRAVTLYSMRHGMISPDGTVNVKELIKALPDIKIDFLILPDRQRTTLDGIDVEDEIRSLEVSSHVSPVAAIPEVRRALVDMQRTLGKDKGIVMDGRDIGTVVFPDAELKVFCNASAETRASRRFKELKAKGDEVTYEEVLKNVVDRDRIDTTRAESPLKRADDALLLDNSDMTLDQQDEWLFNHYQNIISALN